MAVCEQLGNRRRSGGERGRVGGGVADSLGSANGGSIDNDSLGRRNADAARVSKRTLYRTFRRREVRSVEVWDLWLGRTKEMEYLDLVEGWEVVGCNQPLPFVLPGTGPA